MKHLLIAIVLTALVSGCGFHPRGVSTLPDDVRVLYLEAPSSLHDELSVHLLDAGATLVENRADAELVLTIPNEHFDSRTLSVDPDTGKEREFELAYEVAFHARRAGGGVVLKLQTLTLLRDYVFDEDRVIGKSRERGTLQEEMRRDAAQQILTRLNHALEG